MYIPQAQRPFWKGLMVFIFAQTPLLMRRQLLSTFYLPYAKKSRDWGKLQIIMLCCGAKQFAHTTIKFPRRRILRRGAEQFPQKRNASARRQRFRIGVRKYMPDFNILTYRSFGVSKSRNLEISTRRNSSNIEKRPLRRKKRFWGLVKWGSYC